MEKRLIKKEEIAFDEFTEVDVECIKFIPRDFALNNIVFPFRIRENCLYVAMLDTGNDELIERLRLLTRKQIVPCKAKGKQIHSLLNNFYEKEEVENTVENLKKIFRIKDDFDPKNINEAMELENAPIVRLTDYLITQALIKGASDIHIEPQEDKVTVRFRVDGLLFDASELPTDIYGAVITRIKVMSDMDISEKRIPQDGKANFKAGDISYDLRISSLPTIYGEKLVIRILYKSLKWSSLDNLELNADDCKAMKNALRKNHGIIIITGPTGSGKSSTLYAMLNEISSREKNITTIEDPVEINVNGINQVAVNSKAGITFASGLRSILRQDPDVIMVGEIRDEETASIAVRAAITGHLVLSTLHTNDSIGAINRLSEMGIPRYLLADSIVAIVAQRLVRKVCTNCKEEYKPSEREKQILMIKDEILYKGNGCMKCNHSGYTGRHAVSEVLYVDNHIRSIILKNNSDMSLRKYSSDSKMSTLIHSCRELVIQGITTFEEYIKLYDDQVNSEEVEY